MAVRKLRECDVYKTVHDTKQFRVLIVSMDGINGKNLEGELAKVGAHTVYEKEVDLCPRAVKRAKKFCDKMTTPPGATSSE